MNLETTVPIPEGYRFLRAHGQGRVVGFLMQLGRPLRALIIRLDYPEVIMEFVIPSTTGPSVGDPTFSDALIFPNTTFF